MIYEKIHFIQQILQMTRYLNKQFDTMKNGSIKKKEIFKLTNKSNF